MRKAVASRWYAMGVSLSPTTFLHPQEVLYSAVILDVGL